MFVSILILLENICEHLDDVGQLLPCCRNLPHRYMFQWNRGHNRSRVGGSHLCLLTNLNSGSAQCPLSRSLTLLSTSPCPPCPTCPPCPPCPLCCPSCPFSRSCPPCPPCPPCLDFSISPLLTTNSHSLRCFHTGSYLLTEHLKPLSRNLQHIAIISVSYICPPLQYAVHWYFSVSYNLYNLQHINMEEDYLDGQLALQPLNIFPKSHTVVWIVLLIHAWRNVVFFVCFSLIWQIEYIWIKCCHFW